MRPRARLITGGSKLPMAKINDWQWNPNAGLGRADDLPYVPKKQSGSKGKGKRKLKKEAKKLRAAKQKKEAIEVIGRSSRRTRKNHRVHVPTAATPRLTLTQLRAQKKAQKTQNKNPRTM